MLSPFALRKSLCQVLSQSSFDARDLGNSKTAVYIIVPDEKSTLHFLVTMFVKQTYEVLINEAQKHAEKNVKRQTQNGRRFVCVRQRQYAR